MATPMETQYNSLKKKYPDCILFFRMGDFYECFDEDAKVMSKVLNVALTARDKKKSRPMAGIPHHALSSYLYKMIKAGYKVAIAEQMEDPKLAKGIVKRDVIKVVTPGTVLDEKSLDAALNNYIAAIYKEKNNIGLAICDITTGEFRITEYSSINDAVSEIQRVRIAEVLTQENVLPVNTQLKDILINIYTPYKFDKYLEILKDHFNVSTLKGFGIEDYKSGINAAGALLNYLIETQKSALEHISRISYFNPSSYMNLDRTTIQNLELVDSSSGWTLLKILDNCMTSMGKRKLFRWIIRPLIDPLLIEERLDAVEIFMDNTMLLDDIRKSLDGIYDIERILGKIGNNAVNARDMIALKDSLISVKLLSNILINTENNLIRKSISVFKDNKIVNELVELLDKSIHDNPPITITEGNIIKSGYNTELDELRNGAKNGHDWIKDLQDKEIKRTGISSLKVKYNKVFGYYIEISKSNLDKVPDNYVRKQTLVNAERFVTQELADAEARILGADEKSIQMEYEIFQKIRTQIASHIKIIQTIADSVATIDCISNFAFLARNNSYVKPELTKDNIILIKDGRHPVVERNLTESFIANDLKMSDKDGNIHIITGPNMAGKSTYIRQIALIVLMAQAGSFVPAAKMKFHIIDRIFTRVGASDNLSQGESTFMVEMSETASILNNATKDSLIILDEVGRGTSTFDGVAIAWSVVEYLHDKLKAKTLFATHYHELVQMEKTLSKIANYNVAVHENDGKIIFLRKIKKGGTDKSYGVHVAQIAGVPEEIILKAKEILSSLETKGMFNVGNHGPKFIIQQSLFDDVPKESEIEKLLKELDINNITPIKALELLEILKSKISK